MTKDISSPDNGKLTALELCRKVGHPDSPLQWNKNAVALLCEDIRAQVLQDEWTGRAGPTDKRIMLSYLDKAQAMKRLDVIMDARTTATPRT
jgi:hypothetical protein